MLHIEWRWPTRSTRSTLEAVEAATVDVDDVDDVADEANDRLADDAALADIVDKNEYGPTLDLGETMRPALPRTMGERSCWWPLAD